MQAHLPVLAVTDSNTDVGQVISDGGFGWHCESNDTAKFSEQINKILLSDIAEYKNNSWDYLCDNYSVSKIYSKCFETILDRIDNGKRGLK